MPILVPIWHPDPKLPDGGRYVPTDLLQAMQLDPQWRWLLAAAAGAGQGGRGGGGGTGRIAVRLDDATIVPRARFLNFQDYFDVSSAQDGDQADVTLNIYDPDSPTTISIAVAGDEVAAPDLDVPTKIVYVDAQANGLIRLPLLSTVTKTYEYLFCRPPGSATASANLVAIASTAPDTIDGRDNNSTNTPVYFDVGNSNGMGVRLRAGSTCWHAVGGSLAGEGLSLSVATVIQPWSGFVQIFNSANGAIHTLPELSSTLGASMPRTFSALVYTSVPCTFQRAGADVFIGSLNGVDYASATSFPLAANQSALLMAAGANAWAIH